MFIKVPPPAHQKIGHALTSDEKTALDCMQAIGAITNDAASRLGINNLHQAVSGLRAMGHNVIEMTNDPSIHPREYAVTVYTLYEPTEHVQKLLKSLSGFCLAMAATGESYDSQL